MSEAKVINIHRDALKRVCTFCGVGSVLPVDKPSTRFFANRTLRLRLLYDHCDTCHLERELKGINLMRIMYFLEQNHPELIDTFRKVSGYIGATSRLGKHAQQT